jgi:hypothetical protein
MKEKEQKQTKANKSRKATTKENKLRWLKKKYQANFPISVTFFHLASKAYLQSIATSILAEVLS